MAFGLGSLRLSPQIFWAMSPCELIAALGRAAEPLAPAPGDLERLMTLYPDRKKS